nr:hypothetical protein [Tanacetum cinerariifolium]
PKPKASTRKKTSDFASSTTPPTPIATSTLTTTIVAAPRLSAAAKAQDCTQMEQTRDALSQQRGFGTDEGTGSRPGVLDVPSDDSEEELSWNSSDDEDVDEQTKGREESEGDNTDESDDDDDKEETTKIGEQEVAESDEGDDEATESDRESKDEETREQEEESFDPISRTPKDNEDDDNNEEDQGLRIGEKESLESLFTTGSTTKIIKELVKTQVKEQVTRILPRIEEAMNAQLEAEVLTRSSHSSRTSYAVAADLSEMELKKILIDKMEGNKFIQRSDEQRNLYKALVKAYDADKTILDIYDESTTLKRRQEDDDQEGPSAGSDRGSKRRRE